MGILVNWSDVNAWAKSELSCEELNNNSDVYVSGYHNAKMRVDGVDLMQLRFAGQSVYVPVEMVVDLDKVAQRLVQQNIEVCQSSLVDELLGNGFFEWDDVENTSSPKDESDLKYEFKDEWTLYDLAENGPESFVEYLIKIENVAVEYTLGENETLAGNFPDEWDTWQEIESARTNIYLESVDTFTEYLEKVCNEDVNEENEIFEWWSVDSWLAERLKEYGEPILDNGYGIWWGRCTTGQAIYMDGVFQQLAKRYA